MNRSIEGSQPNRKVSFKPGNDKIVFIESRNDLSKKERTRCWHSRAEMRTLKIRSLRDAQRLESGDPNKRLSCSRGLEMYTIQGHASLEDTIYGCIDAVIDEQETQWDNDCDDFDRLAIVSQKASRDSINQAIERAIKDEKEARKIYSLDQQQQQKLQLNPPPTLPIRKMSQDNLTLFFEQQQSFVVAEEQDDEKENSSPMPVSKDLTLKNPKVFARGRSIKDDNTTSFSTTSTHVDLGTCRSNKRKDIGPGRIVPSTTRAKAA